MARTKKVTEEKVEKVKKTGKSTKSDKKCLKCGTPLIGKFCNVCGTNNDIIEVKKPKVDTCKKDDNCNCNCNCDCNCGCNNNIYVKLMFYTVICIFICSLISTVFVIIMSVDSYNYNHKKENRNDYNYASSGSNTGSGSSTGSNNEELNVDYDVSMFQEITVDQLMDLYNGENKSVIYIGRPTCGYCVAFLPSLQQAQEEFGYQTYYYDIDKLTTEDYERIISLNTFLEQNFGYTPMVLVVQNGQIVSADGSGNGWVGYSDYETFKAYLQGLGY